MGEKVNGRDLEIGQKVKFPVEIKYRSNCRVKHSINICLGTVVRLTPAGAVIRAGNGLYNRRIDDIIMEGW